MGTAAVTMSLSRVRNSWEMLQRLAVDPVSVRVLPTWLSGTRALQIFGIVRRVSSFSGLLFTINCGGAQPLAVVAGDAASLQRDLSAHYKRTHSSR